MLQSKKTSSGTGHVTSPSTLLTLQNFRILTPCFKLLNCDSKGNLRTQNKKKKNIVLEVLTIWGRVLVNYRATSHLPAKWNTNFSFVVFFFLPFSGNTGSFEKR